MIIKLQRAMITIADRECEVYLHAVDLDHVWVSSELQDKQVQRTLYQDKDGDWYFRYRNAKCYLMDFI